MVKKGVGNKSIKNHKISNKNLAWVIAVVVVIVVAWVIIINYSSLKLSPEEDTLTTLYGSSITTCENDFNNILSNMENSGNLISAVVRQVKFTEIEGQSVADLSMDITTFDNLGSEESYNHLLALMESFSTSGTSYHVILKTRMDETKSYLAIPENAENVPANFAEDRMNACKGKEPSRKCECTNKYKGSFTCLLPSGRGDKLAGDTMSISYIENISKIDPTWAGSDRKWFMNLAATGADIIVAATVKNDECGEGTAQGETCSISMVCMEAYKSAQTYAATVNPPGGDGITPEDICSGYKGTLIAVPNPDSKEPKPQAFCDGGVVPVSK